QIRALIDGKKIIVTEASIRRDLQLQDTEVHFDYMVKNLEAEKKQKSRRKERKEIEVPHTELQPKESVPTTSNDLLPSALKEVGEGSEVPTDNHHTPIVTQPLSSQPQKKQKSRRKERKEIEVLDLEKAKTAQAKEIADLKKRVKKLKRKKKSRTSAAVIVVAAVVIALGLAALISIKV
nr:hypothetical protein [Tanacetum cinerariifolium]